MDTPQEKQWREEAVIQFNLLPESEDTFEAGYLEGRKASALDEKKIAGELEKLRNKMHDELGNGYLSVVGLSSAVKRMFTRFDDYLNSLNSK
jgi:hypothetical protein